MVKSAGFPGFISLSILNILAGCLDIFTTRSLRDKKPSYTRFKDRQALLDSKWHDDDGLIVFDELHKYKNWKNWIKGVFDTNEGPAHFLVTGSARLEDLMCTDEAGILF